MIPTQERPRHKIYTTLITDHHAFNAYTFEGEENGMYLSHRLHTYMPCWMVGVWGHGRVVGGWLEMVGTSYYEEERGELAEWGWK